MVRAGLELGKYCTLTTRLRWWTRNQQLQQNKLVGSTVEYSETRHDRLPYTHVFIMWMVDNRSPCAEFDCGHGWHGAGKHRTCWKKIFQLVQSRFLTSGDSCVWQKFRSLWFEPGTSCSIVGLHYSVDINHCVIVHYGQWCNRWIGPVKLWITAP